MFWSKDKDNTDKRENIEGQCVGKNTDRQQLHDEALANAASAREAIGPDTLDRIAKAIKNQESSDLGQAKSTLNARHGDELAAEIKDLLGKE